MHLVLFTALTMLLQTAAFAADEQVYLLAMGHFRCNKETVITEIADSSSIDQLKERLTAGIRKGVCLISRAPAPQVIVQLRKAYSPQLSNPYYCYKLADEGGEVLPDIDCSLAQHVMTLSDAIARRIGDYIIRGQHETQTSAECHEGGRVWLDQRNGALLRTVAIFHPLEPKVDVPTHSNVEDALRDGCKGIDYGQ